MATTTRDILADWRARISPIPHVKNDYVCRFCLGPVANYDQCYSCKSIFIDGGAPTALRTAVVPMSATLNPSPWYTALYTYKTFDAQMWRVLFSVTHHFLLTHRSNIEAMLGGPWSMITIVPSKKGIAYKDQPLRKALSLTEPIASQLRQTLTYNPKRGLGRREYGPDAFSPGPDLRGSRILLIEDTWVTGATSVSAAGALLDAEARSVAILPIARMVRETGWPPETPYRRAMAQPYDIDDKGKWPR